MLYTKAVVSGTKLTTRDGRCAMENVCLSPEFGQREAPLFLDVPEFPYNTVYDKDKLRVASTPKTSWIRLAVLIHYQLVRDTGP